MKKHLIRILAVLVSSFAAQAGSHSGSSSSGGYRSGGQVRSYDRSDGTHVSGYYRHGSYVGGSDSSSSSGNSTAIPSASSAPAYWHTCTPDERPYWRICNPDEHSSANTAMTTPTPKDNRNLSVPIPPPTRYFSSGEKTQPDSGVVSWFNRPSIPKLKGFHDKNGTYYLYPLNSAVPQQERTAQQPIVSRSFSSRSTPTGRDSHGLIKRSESAKREFMQRTGYPHGRPGYVIDHIIPLSKGGLDDPSNMQWQTIAEGKAKDKWERH